MNALIMKKEYLTGNPEEGGYWKIYINKTTITLDELKHKYDLYKAEYKNKYYNIGVRTNKDNLWDPNDVASALFETIINGDCIIVFRGECEKKYDITCNVIKSDLIKKGCISDAFNY